MAIERMRPAGTDEMARDSMELARIQAEAAREARTIGSFRTGFRRRIDAALREGIMNGSMASERMSAVEAATEGNEDIRLDTTENGVLGYNRIGAGRGGMRLSRDTFANIVSDDQRDDVRQTVAHEAAHGEHVALTGELTVNGRQVDHLELNEGHAEIHGNEAVGMSSTEHRDGQPVDVYRDGQNIAVEIIRRAGRAAFERALTQDGDLSGLQRAMAA